MRTSGILMHITSLPSPGGIGSLGHEAYAFADFLHNSGMTIWQVLPIGPTGYGESPYQSTSVFAGNPLLISPELLREEGLLDFSDADLYQPGSPDRVDFEQVRKNKLSLLRKSFLASGKKISEEIETFTKAESWVYDFAMFTAVKENFGNIKWTSWPDEGIRFRRKDSVEEYGIKLKNEIDFHIFCQFVFRKQWFALKKYCNEKDIRIFGDMPIYVAEDSADTWTHPDIFQLDRKRIPKRVAGVPPDYFSEDGQLWGNPLYRWTWLKFHNYSWWVDRMKGMSSLYDLVRIDHFIGFANYYSVPYGAPNARNGKWVKGPGKSLFKRLQKEVPDINIIAEDLGAVNARVRRLLDWCGYPGMKIMIFGFDSDETNPHYISNYSKNTVAYTGTHDNDTVAGWAEKAEPAVLKFAEKTCGFSTIDEAPAAFIRILFETPCDTVIVPMQDLLGLGGDARMNYPGTIGGNWEWRMTGEVLTDSLSARIRELVDITDRRKKNVRC